MSIGIYIFSIRHIQLSSLAVIRIVSRRAAARKLMLQTPALAVATRYRPLMLNMHFSSCNQIETYGFGMKDLTSKGVINDAERSDGEWGVIEIMRHFVILESYRKALLELAPPISFDDTMVKAPYALPIYVVLAM
jgi:hypothetical protein